MKAKKRLKLELAIQSIRLLQWVWLALFIIDLIILEDHNAKDQ